MTKEELLIEMEKFLCDKGKYQQFLSYMEDHGYEEKEIEEVFEESR